MAKFPFPLPIDYSKQAFEVPGTRRPGQTGHYRNSAHPDLLTIDSPGMPFRTVPEIIDFALKTYPASIPWLGHLPVLKAATAISPAVYADKYVWMTYGEGDKRRRDIGAGIQLLYEQGLAGPNDQGLEVAGIWSINRPEWHLLDLALLPYSRVSVSLYDTLGADAVEYIINHAQIPLVFTTANHIQELLSLTGKCPTLKVLVCIDDLDHNAHAILKGWATEKGVNVFLLSEIEKSGRENPREFRLPKPEDVATISYTSGTTGNPKGVVLTHGTIAVGVHSHAIGAFDEGETAGKIFFSYLPLAHIYGRIHELIAMEYGLGLGYFSGDILRLLEDARILQPHMFIAVPRVLNRIYTAVKTQMDAPGVKGALIRRAYETKLKNLHETGENKHAFWDRILFNKVKALLGGRIELLTSGAAPISAEVLDFFKVVFSCNVLQGYGMTENCGTTSHCLVRDTSDAGTVGPPSVGNEVKLVDVPEMGYRSSDKPNPRGEVCMRGQNAFSVYYKDPKNTASTKDDEGWIHTGDVGQIDSKGRFMIIDRVKNIMKLAQGEYVALEKVESAYSLCPLIAQIYVHGDGLREYVIAVVVPDPLQFAPFASKVLGKKVEATDGAALAAAAKDPKVNEAFLDTMTTEAQKQGLKGFETVKRIHISLEPFTIENNILTATLKLKRRDAFARYKGELEGLYALGGPTTGRRTQSAKL